ncbi:MAG: 3-methyladenine DNA glycosylase [Anaerolineae bacterium]|jgi:3-methyladenine DNA glycosylase/8-oxoguanine DNA glycosylase|nr:3-methyladenine DNA glycosylase [Anaerolineae bacterium]
MTPFAQQHTLRLAAPPAFDFVATVTGHGWLELPPYQYDAATQTLQRRQRLADGTPVRVHLRATPRQIELAVYAAAPLSAAGRAEVRQTMHRCLALDWSLTDFYALLAHHPGYDWVAAGHHGRLLVGPTVWEDLVKTLLTTNTTWGQTIAMCRRLCALGDPCEDGHTFPRPPHIAPLSAAALAAQTGMGYRADYLLALAQRIEQGDLDVEAWATLPADALYAAVRGLKGFGDYAAGTMLRLLGHFDRLPLDTVARAAYQRLSGRADVTDADLRAYYERFGAWRGLALWMDCIRSEAMQDSMQAARPAGT